jgi:CubicO group peptidase (beta-lactamase class C family)
VRKSAKLVGLVGTVAVERLAGTIALKSERRRGTWSVYPRMMRCVALLYLALSGMAGAQPGIPDTPAGAVLRSWLEAFNSGASAALLAFWQKYGSDAPERHVAMDQRLRGMTGGLTLFKVMRNDETHLVAVMKEGGGRYTETTLDLASVNPPVVQAIMCRPAPAPHGEEHRAASDHELAERVVAHAASLAAKDEFSGAILIWHNGNLVLDRAWGLADRDRQTRNTADTQFCLGSTLGDYWPDYPNHDLAARLRIRHLLSHTGGTGDIFTPEYEAHRLETRTLADYVKLFGSRPLQYDPGSRMEYSNYGFILLGRLIEIVSGESYEDYVRKHIYVPAGMTRTDARPEIDHVPGRAVGYTSGPSGLQANTPGLPWAGTSAGGGYSTVGDLLLFAQALESGKLLDPALLRQATTDQTKAGYGFGFYALPDGIFGHGGGSPGMNGEMHVIPKEGYVIAVLANRDPFMATEMERSIEESLPPNPSIR